MPEPIIRLENVSYSYPRSGVWALRNISLEIAEGEFLAVMGENGAGKTTFCKLFNGLIPHSQGGTLRGTVTVDGAMPIALAGRVGMALDDPDIQLFTATVRGELAFGLENLLTPPDEIEEQVRLALDMTGLSGLADASPAALSGGQKQRLAIAAALVLARRVLVLDEPTAQLDPAAARETLALIRRIRAERPLTVIMATHDSEESAEFADRVCVLKNGSIAACDTPRNIFSSQELLRDNWIRPPDLCALANYLKANCLNSQDGGLPFFPLLPDEAKAAVKSWLRGG